MMMALPWPLPLPNVPEAKDWLKGCALPQSVAVGWSGGLDSTALLLALHGCGIRVCAWHIDHGWRAESSAQAYLLRDRAAAWGIPFYCVRVQSPAAKNREAEARKVRYHQFSVWYEAQDVDAVCLAHHLNDQAETVCMRMLQAAGVVGCQGIRKSRLLHEMRVIRPLLHLRRNVLERALQRAGVRWLEDASNQDMSLWRNAIRHRLFPHMQRAGVEPVSFWLRWQQQAERVAMQLAQEADAVSLHVQENRISVDWALWAQCSAPVRAYILQRMVAALSGAGTAMGRRHIELVERWLKKGGHYGLDLSRCRLLHVDQCLHLDAVCGKVCGSNYSSHP